VVAVHQLERVEQRRQQRTQPGLAGRRVALAQPVDQRLALVQRHHHVGRAVVLPEAIHLDQRRVVERRQQLRLVDEAAQAELERGVVPRRARRHRLAGAAPRQRRRKVFLERDGAPEQRVARAVDDAEAALADQLLDLKLLYPRADRQCRAIAQRFGARGGSRCARARIRKRLVTRLVHRCVGVPRFGFTWHHGWGV
jgi:hypothetical protein